MDADKWFGFMLAAMAVIENMILAFLIFALIWGLFLFSETLW